MDFINRGENWREASSTISRSRVVPLGQLQVDESVVPVAALQQAHELVGVATDTLSQFDGSAATIAFCIPDVSVGKEMAY